MTERIEVVPAAPEQEPVLANLIELYAHDFSEFHNIAIGEDGRFGYPRLSLYWQEPHRHPFLVRIDGRLAGLVLVKKGSEITGNDAVWDMAEFFILRGSRRRGVGMRVAHGVWSRFPGPWEIRVLHANVPARQFWTRAVSAFIAEEIQPACTEKNGGRWDVFSFEAR